MNRAPNVMPIDFDCACGRHFSVSDEYAGKRTKCPSCGGALTVPAPDAPAPGSDEDAAYRALMDGPDPEPTAAPQRRAPEYEERPKPAPKIPAREGPRQVPSAPRASEYEPDPRQGGGFHVSSGTLGGCGMMLGAAVWFGLGWAAGIIYFYPPILFVFGLVAFIRGLLGHSED